MSHLYQFPLEYVQTPYGPCVYMPQDEYVGRSLHEYGWYSPSEVKLLTNILLREAKTFFNVGANQGYLSMAAAHINPQLQVVAFEPQPVMAQLTRMNAPTALVHNIALGSSNGEIQMPTFNYAVTNNYGAVGRENWTGGTPVRLRTLDSWRTCDVDVLQLDVEGMELDVLRGAAETLRACRPTLFLECDRPDTGKEMLRALDEEFNYDVYWAITPLFEDPNPAGNSTNVFGTTAAFNVVGVPRSTEGGRVLREGEKWVLDNLRRASAEDEIGRTDRWLVLG